jgi:hypothetical protein
MRADIALWTARVAFCDPRIPIISFVLDLVVVDGCFYEPGTIMQEPDLLTFSTTVEYSFDNSPANHLMDLFQHKWYILNDVLILSGKHGQEKITPNPENDALDVLRPRKTENSDSTSYIVAFPPTYAHDGVGICERTCTTWIWVCEH